jgi:D-alanine-D-alanine ligase
VEEAVENSREVEVSLFGNDKVEASTCGEIKPGNEFYDYEAKYGDTGSELFIPAKITDSLATKIRQVGIKAYKALGLCGYARADFLINGGTGEFYISEVNTIPGFTDISMFPKLWEKSGLSYKELLTKLVELGFAQYNEKLKYKT